jgi:hypothetical protein
VFGASGFFYGNNSGNPSSSLYANNLGTGDALDVISNSGVGVFATGTTNFGGEFVSSDGSGSVSIAVGDNAFNYGAGGFEYGSTQVTLGAWDSSASPIGVGVYGEGYSASTEGTICCSGFYSIGVWADTSGNSGTAQGIGALTTVDNGYSLISYNNSTLATTWFQNDVTGVPNALVLRTLGGATGQGCTVDVSGNLSC